MTSCEHRLLRLWRVTPEGKVYCCGACGEPFVVTLTAPPTKYVDIGRSMPGHDRAHRSVQSKQ